MASQATAYDHTRENFLKYYAELRDVVAGDKLYGKMQDFSLDWIKKMLDYNVPEGKLVRGMAVFNVLSAMKADEGVMEEDVKRANVLGWCIEWLQAFFLVADDIMDGSITRRGQPCWYKQSHVGMIAFNDSILIESTIYRILKIYFGQMPYYTQLLDLFHEVECVLEMLDLITTPTDKVDLTRYTIENYFDIAAYKTAYYSFYLPVACGLTVAGVTDESAFKVAEEILVPMGQYFQVQDDYLDCYADPEVLGKIGTDIQDNKCSWLVCQALGRCTPEQKQSLMVAPLFTDSLHRNAFQENYGVDDAKHIEAVKEIYKELKLEEVYLSYEQESYAELEAAIAGQTVVPPTVFSSLLAQIYKRQK